MRSMMEVLTEKDWKFAWRVEMLSPMGFRYTSESADATTAFLTAIGAWKKEMLPGAIKQAKAFQNKAKSTSSPKS